MHVLHVVTAGRIGGAERLIADVLVAASRVGRYQASVCVLQRAGDLGEELARAGVPVHELGLAGAVGTPLALASLVRLLRARRVDVVHTHLLHASAIGLTAARLAGTPLAVMTRHYDRYVSMYGNGVDRVLQRTANMLAHHIFAISDAARQTLVHEEGVPATRVTVVENGTDVERIERLALGAGTRAGEGLIVGTVGSLERRKGHEHLLDAIARVRLEPLPRLVLIGDGPERGRLVALAERLGVADRVEFAGYLRNPYPRIAGFDIYAQPSVEEGFGIAVIEAMALERPVVVARSGGLPEIVTDGLNGIVVPPADPRALGDAIARLAADTVLRRRLAAAGKALVAERFDAARTAERYGQAYVELLGSRRLTS